MEEPKKQDKPKVDPDFWKGIWTGVAVMAVVAIVAFVILTMVD